MVILAAVLSFRGFSEDLLWVEVFMRAVPAMKIFLVMNTTTNITMVEDLVVDMVDITD
jgi:hypothetical protein